VENFNNDDGEGDFDSLKEHWPFIKDKVIQLFMRYLHHSRVHCIS
jgi:hypothetical protein